jgi:hypothetical protein
VIRATAALGRASAALSQPYASTIADGAASTAFAGAVFVVKRPRDAPGQVTLAITTRGQPTQRDARATREERPGAHTAPPLRPLCRRCREGHLEELEAAGLDEEAAAGADGGRGTAGEGDAEQGAVGLDVGLEEEAGAGAADAGAPVPERAQAVGTAGDDGVQAGRGVAEQRAQGAPLVGHHLGVVDEQQPRAAARSELLDERWELGGLGDDALELRAFAEL